MSAPEGCQLYLISPPALTDLDGFTDTLKIAIEPEIVSCLQLRLKDAEDDQIRRAANCLLPICDQTETAFILNDRPDLAAELGCDGVHIGPDDMPYAEARQVMGDEAVIGVSCQSSRHLAMSLASEGADYVAFGAFYPTTTKANTETVTPEILEIWSETTTVPSVAIGGITPENCRPLVEAGADFIATCSAVWNHPDGPETAIRLFSERMAN